MADNMIFYNKQSLQRGRRKSVRFPIVRPVEFMELEPESSPMYSGSTVNLSKGGMLLLSSVMIPVDSALAFKITQEKPAKTIYKGLSRVVRCNPAPQAEGRFELGCRFELLLTHDRYEDWVLLREAATQALGGAKSAPEAGQPVSTPPPRAVPPASCCPVCGFPVSEEDVLCANCREQIDQNFSMDRHDLFEQHSARVALDRMPPWVANAVKIIRKLEEKGGREAVPYLLKALESDQPVIVEAAGLAIQKIEARQASSTSA